MYFWAFNMNNIYLFSLTAWGVLFAKVLVPDVHKRKPTSPPCSSSTGLCHRLEHVKLFLFDQETQWLLTNLLGSPCGWPFSTLSLKLTATSSETSPRPHFLKSVLFVGLSCSPDFPPLKFTLQFHLPVFLSSSSLTSCCVNSIRPGTCVFSHFKP